MSISIAAGAQLNGLGSVSLTGTDRIGTYTVVTGASVASGGIAYTLSFDAYPRVVCVGTGIISPGTDFTSGPSQMTPDCPIELFSLDATTETLSADSRVWLVNRTGFGTWTVALSGSIGGGINKLAASTTYSWAYKIVS